jgi:peptidylprolyl isomerase
MRVGSSLQCVSFCRPQLAAVKSREHCAGLTRVHASRMLPPMKRIVLLFATAMVGPLGVGCSPPPPTTDTGTANDSGVATDSGTVGDVGAMSDGATMDAGGSDGGSTCAADSGAGDAGGYYLPPGCFTLTPFLSTTPNRDFAMAEMAIEDNKDYAAVIEVSTPPQGDAGAGTTGRIVLDLTEVQTPITVNSFVFLARNHFYDGILFHRVIEGFVAQGGDPNTLTPNRATWGSGGPGYQFTTESVASLQFDGAGVLGMARAMSRESNGSQFFITLAATTSLNGQYTVFGRVIEGMPVLATIARNATMTTPPVNPSTMTRVYIVERPR